MQNTKTCGGFSCQSRSLGGGFHDGQTSLPLRLTLNELGFPQPSIPIKTYDFAPEVIITTTVRQKKSKAMDI